MSLPIGGKALLGLFTVITFFSITLSGICADDAASENTEFFDMSIEELLDVEIVSAARQSQTLLEISTPTSIVTAEDIHYSGLTNLYDVLQFYPGLDMLQIDRNRYALGVRGLHDTLSDRTLSMLNGRIADNPAFGGSEFLRLPLILEDIKQIEVLRGPSGGSWGANALNGAINIITKRPEECQGTYASTQMNDFGDQNTQLRWAHAQDAWSWRISGAYEALESSSDALDQVFPTTEAPAGNFSSRDFHRSGMIDSEVIHTVSDQTTLSMGLGHSNMETGDLGFLFYYPRQDGYKRTTRAFAKLDRQIDPNTSAYVQWYGNLADTQWVPIADFYTLENQLEGQLDFVPASGHATSVGANLRLTRIDQSIMNAQDAVINGTPLDEQRAGVFCIDRWDFSQHLDFEIQGFAEWYSETQMDWAGRASALYTLHPEDHNHVLRFSGAKSYRTPLASLRQTAVSHLGGLLNLTPGDDLDNEQTWALEMGYHGKLNSRSTLQLNTYWQQYRDLIGYVQTTPMNYEIQNTGGSHAYGAEAELTLHYDKAKLRLWYGYNEFTPTDGPSGVNPKQNLRAFLPAKHKAGTTLRIFLPRQLTANINAKCSSKTEGGHGPWGAYPSSFCRVDMTLAKAFNTKSMQGEMLLGVSDLFDETSFTVGDHATVRYQHKTPGRTYFLRLLGRF